MVRPKLSRPMWCLLGLLPMGLWQMNGRTKQTLQALKVRGMVDIIRCLVDYEDYFARVTPLGKHALRTRSVEYGA